jgi:hypothetical protein
MCRYTVAHIKTDTVTAKLNHRTWCSVHVKSMLPEFCTARNDHCGIAHSLKLRVTFALLVAEASNWICMGRVTPSKWS